MRHRFQGHHKRVLPLLYGTFGWFFPGKHPINLDSLTPQGYFATNAYR